MIKLDKNQWRNRMIYTGIVRKMIKLDENQWPNRMISTGIARIQQPGFPLFKCTETLGSREDAEKEILYVWVPRNPRKLFTKIKEKLQPCVRLCDSIKNRQRSKTGLSVDTNKQTNKNRLRKVTDFLLTFQSFQRLIK